MNNSEITNAVTGKYCVIRGKEFGVFAGTVKNVDAGCVLVENTRRLWYWDGAASISQIAAEGVTAPKNCKFSVAVDSIVLRGWIEIIPTTEAARKIIEEVPVWKRQ